MVEFNKENTSAMIADDFGMHFAPVKGGDSEILEIIAEFSLQLSARQQKCLARLNVYKENPNVPQHQKLQIETFLKTYPKNKRYHDTMEFIGRGVDALSLKRYWGQDSMKSDVLLQK